MKFYLLAAFLFVAMVAVVALPVEEPIIDSYSNEGGAGTFSKIKGSSTWLCNVACWSKGKAAGVWEGDNCVCQGFTICWNDCPNENGTGFAARDNY